MMNASVSSRIGVAAVVRSLLVFGVFGIGATGAWAQKPVQNSDGSTTTTYPNGMTRIVTPVASEDYYGPGGTREEWRDQQHRLIELTFRDRNRTVREDTTYTYARDGSHAWTENRYYANGNPKSTTTFRSNARGDAGRLTTETFDRTGQSTGKTTEDVKLPEWTPLSKNKDAGKATAKDTAKDVGKDAAKDAVKAAGHPPPCGGGPPPAGTSPSRPLCGDH